MVKDTPGLGKIAAMVVFTLSCVGILLFLWLAFGGSIPLRPEAYRFQVAFPEAQTLSQEADVRIAGVNVGKVKKKELDKGANATNVEIEIKPDFAPIPKNTRAVLRQKTLLGETYVELTPGDEKGETAPTAQSGGGARSQDTRLAGNLEDGGTLPSAQVEPTVELDEIFNTFDRPTRLAFQDWVKELGVAIRGRAAGDLNDSLGNLGPFAVDGATLLSVLDEQGGAVRRLVRNTGTVFGAINQREGALRELIVNGNDTFAATASRDRALAETIRVFPTFLDESKATLARLEGFARDTRPLVTTLRPAARDLGPAVRDLADLSPDLEGLFRDLPGLVRAGRRGLPALTDVVAATEPFAEAAHVFLPELNPILSEFNFHQATIAGFITNGDADLAGIWGGNRVQTQIGLIDPDKILKTFVTEEDYTRGNTYLQPNSLTRGIALGGYESFHCPGGKELPNADDAELLPPCFVTPPSLLTGKQFITLGKGQAPYREPPKQLEGNTSADPTKRGGNRE